jgi:hypothetical protein
MIFPRRLAIFKPLAGPPRGRDALRSPPLQEGPQAIPNHEPREVFGGEPISA